MNTNELHQLENNIKQAQKIVDLGSALERLKNNRDFKKVIQEGYFEQEAIRLVHLLSDSNMQAPEIQTSIHKQMIAVGGFRDYLDTLETRVGMARRSVEADEATRDEILAEEVK
jgi:hypothetical protein